MTQPAHPTAPQLIGRRDFVRRTALALGATTVAAHASSDAPAPPAPPSAAPSAAVGRDAAPAFTDDHLDQVAFPMGGIGAGTICLDGVGGLTHGSLRNRSQIDNELGCFAAISIRSPEKVARVVEGPVPRWRLYQRAGAAKGDGRTGLGLPRYAHASFRARFPFAHVSLQDDALPLTAELTGWSPFEPGDADNASLPVAGLEYTFRNRSEAPVDAVFSYNATNVVAYGKAAREVRAIPGGVVFYGGPDPECWDEEAWFSVATDAPAVKINHAWFRGGWQDPLTMAWRDIEAGNAYDRPPVSDGVAPTGATLFVPFALSPGESRTIRVRLCWYAPRTHLREGVDAAKTGAAEDTYRPWYAGRFANIEALATYWAEQYASLRERTGRFTDTFYASSIAPAALEAVAANLCILKSPTVLRQTDGRFYGWEGSNDTGGLGHGTCTHVWNYAQTVAHLFPALERSLRETEFTAGQDERGHQNFRVPLPIQPASHTFHAAADGQLGGIIKTHREWRISGDTAWLRRWWPKVRASLDYCIATWDPGHKGWVEEPHHNTYDIEFWGPDGMCTSFYLAALHAAVRMGQALGDDVSGYSDLLAKGTARADAELFNGEYYQQIVDWTHLRARNPADAQSLVVAWGGGTYSPEARALLEAEGPKYQYGSGCLSDGVLGAWLAEMCGLGPVLSAEKVKSHLRAVHRHNLKRDLSAHPNPQRPGYANGRDGGLLLCSWPRGGQPSLPFVYSNEVWTGIEYQAASHMITLGLVEEGLEVVRTCRARYDGQTRNPFDEYEWGHWYARAMASYGLLQALSGARYDAVERVLHLAPPMGGDFQCFLATATGYGLVGVRSGEPFFTVVAGEVPVARIDYRAA
jgi:uncharacterized protein (DUF608 family)